MSFSGRPDSYSQSSADLPLSKQLQKLRKFSANQPHPKTLLEQAGQQSITDAPASQTSPFQPRQQLNQFQNPNLTPQTPKRLNKYTLQNQDPSPNEDHSSKPRSIIKKNSKYKEYYKQNAYEDLPTQQYQSQSVDHKRPRADSGDYGYNPRRSEGQGDGLGLDCKIFWEHTLASFLEWNFRLEFAESGGIWRIRQNIAGICRICQI